MGCFERASPALKEILLRIQRVNGPTEIDQHVYEFGSVHYHIRHSSSDPVYTYLSISTPLLLSQGLPFSTHLPQHTLQMVNAICPRIMEAIAPQDEAAAAEYQLTLKLNLSRIPQGKASIKMISDISSVQAVILSCQLKEILRNVDSREIVHGMCKPIKLTYHPREPFFVIKQPSKITAVFLMRFKEKEDVIIATAFFQELMDVGSSEACKRAPHCIWSPIPPPELRGELIEDLSTNGGFVSFDITSRHVEGKKLDKTVWNLLNFYTFVKNHVKPLHNVETEEDQPTKKKPRRRVLGCTPVGKWIRDSKLKIMKRKYDFTNKMKRIRSRIKIQCFSRFRRLRMPKFSPVTRYIKLE
ncbi:hypothetical protein ACS0TY_022928 [Phlomoides rotata]